MELKLEITVNSNNINALENLQDRFNDESFLKSIGITENTKVESHIKNKYTMSRKLFFFFKKTGNVVKIK